MLHHLQTAQQLAKATNQGSPLVVEVVGRLCGLGADERNVLARYGVPGVVWGTVALVGGVALGAYLQRNHPRYLPRVLGGRR